MMSLRARKGQVMQNPWKYYKENQKKVDILIMGFMLGLIAVVAYSYAVAARPFKVQNFDSQTYIELGFAKQGDIIETGKNEDGPARYCIITANIRPSSGLCYEMYLACPPHISSGLRDTGYGRGSLVCADEVRVYRRIDSTGHMDPTWEKASIQYVLQYSR